MNKIRFLISIVIVFVSSFCFNIDVFATQELTCLYKKNNGLFGFGANQIGIVQSSDRKITIYRNTGGDETSEIDYEKWEATDQVISFSNENSRVSELDHCYGYVNTKGIASAIWPVVDGTLCGIL